MLSITKSKFNILDDWWQSIYIQLSLWQKPGFNGYKILLQEWDLCEAPAPHWGFITGILRKHYVKKKVNQLSKIKITLSKCHIWANVYLLKTGLILTVFPDYVIMKWNLSRDTLSHQPKYILKTDLKSIRMYTIFIISIISWYPKSLNICQKTSE